MAHMKQQLLSKQSMQPVQCKEQADIRSDREVMGQDTLQRSLFALVHRLEAPAPKQAALVSICQMVPCSPFNSCSKICRHPDHDDNPNVRPILQPAGHHRAD